ncbi:ATP-binding cassette domain-containing protein [Roseateles sp. NT4]|uniref:ATP-binding cassette domain-containing protein n=1 Tax=Roseateles sp. NT4 TaxID=3453715 RepID=UPI003EECF2DE
MELSWSLLHRHRLSMGVVAAAIFLLSMTASLLIATYAVVHGTMTVGGFVLASVYSVQLFRPLELLGAATRDVSQSLAFVGPILDVFKTTSKRTQDASFDSKTAPPSRHDKPVPHIAFRGVTLSFDSAAPVLEDFHLVIPPGRSVGIVGASGCGKTSLVRLLMRLHEPDAGTILIDGQTVNDMPVSEVRSMIAVVPQDVMVLNATLAANIGMGKHGASSAEIATAAELAGLDGLISTLPEGYDTVIGERGLRLSGGERQRIAIARAILKDPLVFVFDEATSMLDGTTENLLLRRLKAVAGGRTTITIAHRLSAVQDADEIVVLEGGKVSERGNHASLIAQGGLYAEMWQLQQSTPG